MRLLLDTSTVLWWLGDDRKLGARARAEISDPGNEVFVSAVSAWEISVKRAGGKLEARFDIADALERSYFIEFPIDVEHAVAAGSFRRTTGIRSTGCSSPRRRSRI